MSLGRCSDSSSANGRSINWRDSLLRYLLEAYSLGCTTIRTGSTRSARQSSLAMRLRSDSPMTANTSHTHHCPPSLPLPFGVSQHRTDQSGDRILRDLDPAVRAGHQEPESRRHDQLYEGVAERVSALTNVCVRWLIVMGSNLPLVAGHRNPPPKIPPQDAENQSDEYIL